MPYEEVRDIIAQKFDNIHSLSTKQTANLLNSGTWYIYPTFSNDTIVKFTDVCGRRGFIFQIIETHNVTKTKKQLCFLVHERYKPNICEKVNLVYSGPSNLFWDCVVTKSCDEKFHEKIRGLVDGEVVTPWYDSPPLGVTEIPLENQVTYTLGTCDEIKPQAFLVVSKSALQT